MAIAQKSINPISPGPKISFTPCASAAKSALHLPPPMKFTFLLLTLIHAVAIQAADLKLAAIFSDHMVLQNGVSVTVWGTADAGAMVSVAFAGQKQSAVADGEGRWLTKLDSLAVSEAPQTMVVSCGGMEQKCEDVLVGEVWHASGQSNMEMNVGSVAAGLEVVKAQMNQWNLPAIRFRSVKPGESATPLSEVAPGSWQLCSPSTVTNFSAAAFFFARRLHAELKVPVGVIDTSRGGTPIEPYIPLEAFADHSTLRRELELGDQNDLAGLKALPGGVFARDANWLPGRLFNSRLAPLARFPVRGVIWYQGESNSGVEEDPREYEQKMRALMNGWRAAFHQEKLPFYFVQLPVGGAGDNWPQLREEQRRCAGLPHAGMAVTIDLEGSDIHPLNKVDVGERLAKWALAKDYGQPIAFSGPLFSRAEMADGKFLVHFEHVGSGLMVGKKVGLEVPVETPGIALKHFELQNEAGAWFPADAEIAGQVVIVKSAQVQNPRSVRYAFSKVPLGCNLYNRDGLPGAPFTTEEKK